jgi:polar amino acid transport system substrate-binding protein
MIIDSAIVAAFAPTGALRAAINLGNPILATATPDSGPKGVSVDLARGFAERLSVPLEMIVLDAAGKSVDAVARETADIGFFAVDPLRSVDIAFTAPYVLIEGSYLVHQQSTIRSNDEVDRAEHRVVVGKGSAYDLYLTRELKRAQIVRAPTSPTVVDTFIAEQAEVAAGVRQQLAADAGRIGGLRLLPGGFMVIRQALGLPKSRGPIAWAMLTEYVEEMKGSGFVAASLKRHGIAGASVAPGGLATGQS